MASVVRIVGQWNKMMKRPYFLSHLNFHCFGFFLRCSKWPIMIFATATHSILNIKYLLIIFSRPQRFLHPTIIFSLSVCILMVKTNECFYSFQVGLTERQHTSAWKQTIHTWMWMCVCECVWLQMSEQCARYMPMCMQVKLLSVYNIMALHIDYISISGIILFMHHCIIVAHCLIRHSICLYRWNHLSVHECTYEINNPIWLGACAPGGNACKWRDLLQFPRAFFENITLKILDEAW